MYYCFTGAGALGRLAGMYTARYGRAAALAVLVAVVLAGCEEAVDYAAKQDLPPLEQPPDEQPPDTVATLAVPECLSITQHTSEVIILGPNRLTSESDLWSNACSFTISIYYCMAHLEWDDSNIGRLGVSSPWGDDNVLCGVSWREAQPYYTRQWRLDPDEEHWVTVAETIEAMIGNDRYPPGDTAEWSVEYHYAVCRGHHRDLFDASGEYIFTSNANGDYVCRSDP